MSRLEHLLFMEIYPLYRSVVRAVCAKCLHASGSLFLTRVSGFSFSVGHYYEVTLQSRHCSSVITVQLGYNFRKGTEYFVSL